MNNDSDAWVNPWAERRPVRIIAAHRAFQAQRRKDAWAALVIGLAAIGAVTVTVLLAWGGWRLVMAGMEWLAQRGV